MLDNDVTRILDDFDDVERDTLGGLVPDVYRELRVVADRLLRNERRDHTLQATALVHEAYVRLASGNPGQWNDRTHFFRAAAKTMRWILVNHAQSRQALKRGGERRRIALTEAAPAAPEPGVDVLALEEALTKMATFDRPMSQIVELRFFAGCTSEQIAETLEISTRTVDREWRIARAWLRKEIEPQHGLGADD